MSQCKERIARGTVVRSFSSRPAAASTPIRQPLLSVYVAAARFLLRLVCVTLLLLAGVAQQAHAAGRWCISNDVLQFGNRAVGSNTTANVTVSNCGDADWSFTEVSVHPSTGPAFHVSGTCATGLTLGPGQACSVTVLFSPQAAGQTSGGVWLRNTTNTPTQLLTFYGRGVDAQASSASIAFVPSSAIFADQEIGKESDAKTIELRNLGPSALTPTAMVLNGPEVYDFSGYAVTCQVGVPIAAGQSCLLSLSFKPQDSGVRRANLVIDSPQLSSLAILQISGTGVTAGPVVAPDTGGGPADIPTLSDAMLAALAAVLAAAAVRSIHRGGR
jgi:hypothetical protein